MSRLIDAETVKEQVKLYFNKFARDGLKTEIIERATNDIAEVIDNVPAVVAEQHGHWIGIDDEPCETYECDKCGYITEEIGCNNGIPNNFNYCPNCGASMDEVEE